jgi:hypothetical protein
MVAEVRAFREAHPEMTEAEAIDMLVELTWMERFGENTEFERRYYEAKAYEAGHPRSENARHERRNA